MCDSTFIKCTNTKKFITKKKNEKSYNNEILKKFLLITTLSLKIS